MGTKKTNKSATQHVRDARKALARANQACQSEGRKKCRLLKISKSLVEAATEQLEQSKLEADDVEEGADAGEAAGGERDIGDTED